MKSAISLFEEAIFWLRANYLNYRFFTERDVVWTIQTHIISVILKEKLPYKVMNDYPILRGKRRSLCADITMLDFDERPELVAEFKYEPAHKREDIPRSKFPVVFWNEGILKDIERIHTFTSGDFTGDRTAKVAYALFIDEGSHFKQKQPPPGSRWEDWNISIIPPHNVSVLWSKAESVER